MAASEALKKFRSNGYGEKETPKEESSPGGQRTIKLTDSEVKELQAYSKGPGTEQQCLVTGRLGEDGEFSVTSVHNPEGGSTMPDQEEMASQVMNRMGQPPMMQPQTMPSPS